MIARGAVDMGRGAPLRLYERTDVMIPVELLNAGFLLILGDDSEQTTLYKTEGRVPVQEWRDHYSLDEVLGDCLRIVGQRTATHPENVFINRIQSTNGAATGYSFHVHGIRTRRVSENYL